MIDVDNAMTTDRYIASNPAFLYQDNSLESPKQDKDTSVLTDYGYTVGSEHEDVSNEALEQIQEGIFWGTLQLQMSKWLHGESPWDFNIAFPTFHKVPESPSTDIEEDIDKNTIWNEILEELDTLVRWREEWAEDDHEHEPEKPSELALSNAKRVVKELLSTVLSEGKEVLAPFISYDEDDYITLVWHKGKHELYLEITEDKTQYVTVWGINIDSEMDAGVPNKDNYLTLWEWLLNG